MFEKHSLLGEGSCAKVHAMRHRGTGERAPMSTTGQPLLACPIGQGPHKG